MWGGPKPLFYDDEETPKSVEDYRALADSCFTQFEKWRNNKDGWTELSHGVPNVDFYEKKIEGFDIPMFRIEGVLSASVDEVFDTLENCTEQEKKEIDPMVGLWEIVEAITSDLDIVYGQYPVPFPISSRDICAFRYHKKLPDGTCLSLGQTINFAARPQTSAFVRAKGKSCTYFVPVEGEPYKTRLIRFTVMNPMGNIPNWVLTLGKSQAAKSFVKLELFLKKKYNPERTSEKILEFGYESESESGNDIFYDVTELSKNSDFLQIENIPQNENQNLQKNIQNIIVELKENAKKLNERLQIIEKKSKNGFFFNWWTIFGTLVGWPVILVVFYKRFWNREKKRFSFM